MASATMEVCIEGSVWGARSLYERLSDEADITELTLVTVNGVSNISGVTSEMLCVVP